MSEELRIQLFGGLSISQHGTLVGGFISSKVPALLAYLAVTRRAHSRESLAALLWGELADADAKNNLRQALSNLRKFFGPYLLVTREAVQFNEDASFFLDTQVFSQALEAGDLAAAAALYQGEFLAGFQVREATAFEEWVLFQQVQWHEQAMRVLGELTVYFTGQGEYPQAIDAANRLLALDPWREEAHRQVMLLQARSGQYSAAMAQYQACRAILRREFDADTSRETAALYERIRNALHTPRHNLPAPVTGFVGREDEMTKIRHLLASPEARLITILGPGGVGKTRLALETAAACQMMFLDGVWFIPLGSDSSPTRDHLVIAIAEALGCVLSDEDPPTQQLATFLRSKELLLVVDNLEDWLDAVAVFSDLLVQAPEIKVLATSRQRLDLQAEQVFYLEGLATGDASQLEAEPPAASRLFVQRARRLQPDFTPSAKERAAIYRIGHLVGGLPLGIEMAASWVHQFPCAEIAVQIQASLDFLKTAYRDTSPRHASLRGVFDWSWEQLSPTEQSAFRRLAVFSGPFSRQAAYQAAATASDILAVLVDKSLLWRRGDLFQMHEVARQFGLEKLEQAVEAQNIVQRHARYYADWLARQQTRLLSSEQQNALAEIACEYENARQAWEWLVSGGDVAGIAAALGGLYHFLAIRSRFIEALEMFGSARQALQSQVKDGGLATLTYYRLQAREGRFLSFLSHFDQANERLLDCLKPLRDLDASDEVAFVLGHLGGTARMQGNLEKAEQYLEECLELRRQTGNLPGQAVALLELAGVAFMAAEYATACERCLAGLAIAEQCGDQQTQAHMLTGLSLSCRELGDLGQALAYGQRAAVVYEALEDRYGVIQAALTLGELSRQLGEYEQAREHCQKAIQVSGEISHRSGEADGHYRLGQIEADCGDLPTAQHHQMSALELAQACHELPLMYDTLFEIACLLEKNNAESEALLIQTWLQNQPETSGQTLGKIANRLSQLPPEAVASAAQTAQTMSQDDLIQFAQAHR